MPEWYAPGDITFTPEQCIWLIEHLDMLRSGVWPANPSGGYTDAAARTPVRPHARFETPCQFAAEIEARLESTKEAGEALVDEVQAGITWYEYLSRPARRALNYISGWRRRSMPYAKWRANKGWREKGKFTSKKAALDKN